MSLTPSPPPLSLRIHTQPLSLLGLRVANPPGITHQFAGLRAGACTGRKGHSLHLRYVCEDVSTAMGACGAFLASLHRSSWHDETYPLPSMQGVIKNTLLNQCFVVAYGNPPGRLLKPTALCITLLQMRPARVTAAYPAACTTLADQPCSAWKPRRSIAGTTTGRCTPGSRPRARTTEAAAMATQPAIYSSAL